MALARKYLSPLYEYSRAIKVQYQKPDETNKTQYLVLAGQNKIIMASFSKPPPVPFSISRWYVKHRVHPDNRKRMDGLYECVLCASCTTSCPSWWWNREMYVGPAAMLQMYRWTIEPLDENLEERLAWVRSNMKVDLCHNIFQCTIACPKYLNPALAIKKLKAQLHPMAAIE